MLKRRNESKKWVWAEKKAMHRKSANFVFRGKCVEKVQRAKKGVYFGTSKMHKSCPKKMDTHTLPSWLFLRKKLRYCCINLIFYYSFLQNHTKIIAVTSVQLIMNQGEICGWEQIRYTVVSREEVPGRWGAGVKLYVWYVEEVRHPDLSTAV